MKIFYDTINIDKLAKRSSEAPRWLWKKSGIQGAVFLAGSRLYTWYVECLPKTCNAGDQAFYDTININPTAHAVCQPSNQKITTKCSFFCVPFKRFILKTGLLLFQQFGSQTFKLMNNPSYQMYHSLFRSGKLPHNPLHAGQYRFIAQIIIPASASPS